MSTPRLAAKDGNTVLTPDIKTKKGKEERTMEKKQQQPT